MKIEKVKGMKDLLPSDMEKYRLVCDTFTKSCLSWGYQEVKPPTLESLHLFTSAGTLTPGMLGKVYSFLDWDGWSGERVVLRPDGTIPAARLYTEQMDSRELAKIFYIVNTFIFEETGTANREKWLCGAELIGMRSPIADVELIALAIEILNKLGFSNIELRLSHAGLTMGILNELGLNKDERNEVFDRLLDGDTSAISKIKSEKPELAPMLELQGKSSGFVKNIVSTLGLKADVLKAQVEDFLFITEKLQTLGYDFKIDISSVRGFEYYTGVMFQLFINGVKVGSGGRYDALIQAMSGSATPASGFSLYLNTLMNLIDMSLVSSEKRQIVMIHMNAENTAEAFSLGKSLRDAGYIVKFHLGGKGPSEANWRVEIVEGGKKYLVSDFEEKNKNTASSIQGILGILKQ
jgi:histidyl-tRNA synthetase